MIFLHLFKNYVDQYIYIYADTASGGVGLWDLFDEYNLKQIV